MKRFLSLLVVAMFPISSYAGLGFTEVECEKQYRDRKTVMIVNGERVVAYRPEKGILKDIGVSFRFSDGKVDQLNYYTKDYVQLSEEQIFVIFALNTSDLENPFIRADAKDKSMSGRKFWIKLDGSAYAELSKNGSSLSIFSKDRAKKHYESSELPTPSRVSGRQ